VLQVQSIQVSNKCVISTANGSHRAAERLEPNLLKVDTAPLEFSRDRVSDLDHPIDGQISGSTTGNPASQLLKRQCE